LRDLIRIKNPIKAYHGSPHDFDAFELSKIGTGEGAQSYGHGLYFAERPENAEFYRSAVSAAHAAGMKGGVRPLGSTTRQELALMQQLRDGYHAATQQHAPFAVFRDLPSFYNARQRFLSGEMGEVAQRGYREAEARLRASRLGGHLYEVNLHATPDEFLDWDARLSQQGEKVRQSVSRIDAEALKDPPTLSQIPDLAIRDVIRQALKQNEGRARDLELVIDNDGRLYQSIVDHAKRKGVDLATNDMRASDYVYQRASQFLDQLHASQEHTGEALHRMLGSKGNDMIGQAHVASRLREAGIPGIKYLDQGSRAAGEGTRNYVVFDDRLIEIVKKYGIAGAVSAGLLSEAQARQLAAQGGAPTGTR
jgi:hypothetical protein